MLKANERYDHQEMRQRIIRAMLWGKHYTAAEIADRIGEPRTRRVAFQMKNLVESGHLEITGEADKVPTFAFREFRHMPLTIKEETI